MSRARKPPRHTVTVSIAGERHVLRSDAPPEYTQAVAEHVDNTVRALGDAQPVQPHRTVILAALFITDELFRARRELDRLRVEVDARATQLAERVEEALQPTVADADVEDTDREPEDADAPESRSETREPDAPVRDRDTAVVAESLADAPSPDPERSAGSYPAPRVSDRDARARSAGVDAAPRGSPRQLELEDQAAATEQGALASVPNHAPAEREAEQERRGGGDDEGPQRSLL